MPRASQDATVASASVRYGSSRYSSWVIPGLQTPHLLPYFKASKTGENTMTAAPVIRAALLAAALVAAPLVDGKTLRYSSHGDITTIPPHVTNEGFTNAFLDSIYEPLGTPAKDLKCEPCL